MLLENRLKELAQENDELLDTYSMWKVMKKNIADTLNNISIYFPHFSLHNATHSNTICIQVGRLLGEERVKKLSFSDIFLMLLSFYMHDIGMSLKFKNINEDFQSKEFKQHLINLSELDSDLGDAAKRVLNFCNSEQDNKIYKNDSIKLYADIVVIIEDLYRRDHGIRSAAAIRSGTDLLNNIGLRFVEVLADICEMHQNDIEKIMNLPYKSNGMFDDYIHPRFIAAMLCLGDLLDLDTDRFDDKLIQAVSPMPNNSELHKSKHRSIRQFLVEPTGIEIISDSEKIEVYRIIREWVGWIKNTCDFLSINWAAMAPENFGMAPHVEKCELYINGNKKWADLYDLKFNLSNQRAFELLSGTEIYNNKFVCIREIIQNAVDATIFKIIENYKINSKTLDFEEFLAEIKWEDFKIIGNIVIHNDGKIEISLRDKGIGISINDVKRIASITKKRNDEKLYLLKNMPEWICPSGAFGLGVHSIFQLTDKFQIITKVENEEAKKITFETLNKENGYITIEDYKSTFRGGTEVQFIIDSDKIDIYDVECSSYSYATEKKELIILKKINSIYNNQFSSKMVFGKMRHKDRDYIPVEINIQKDEGRTNQLMLSYSSVFETNDGNSSWVFQDEIDLGTIDFPIKSRIWDAENMCQLFCRIAFISDKKHKYSETFHYDFDYGSAFFYRNTLVSTNESAVNLRDKELSHYLDLKINLFAGTADKILKLDRHSLQKRYEHTLNKIVKNSTKNSIKKIINKIISNEISGDEKLGDKILVMFQLAKFYDYRVDELKNKYCDTLKSIKIGKYYYMEKVAEQFFGYQELLDKELYFIVQPSSIDDKFIPQKAKIEHLDVQKKYCLLGRVDSDNFNGKHIINHRADKIFIGKLDKKYYIFVKAKAFECNHGNLLCEMDDFTILYNLVSAILNDSRCIDPIIKYKNLLTPRDTRSYNCFRNKNEYNIELPFDSQIVQCIKKELLKNSFLKDIKVSTIFTDVIESEKFENNIQYIIKFSNHKTKKENIVKDYRRFTEDLLSLLENETYEPFIKFVKMECRKPGYRSIHERILRGMPYINLSY